MSRNINIQVINKHTARERLRAIFAARFSNNFGLRIQLLLSAGLPQRDTYGTNPEQLIEMGKLVDW